MDWLCSVDCWFSHAVSGARAAVKAEFTAAVTSMPEDEDPVAAWRIELISMPELEDEEPKSEFKADTELITPAYFQNWTASSCCPGSFDSKRNRISAFLAAAFRLLGRKKVAPEDATKAFPGGFFPYWRSFRTACCAWLDCDRAAMPVCSRTLYCVMEATVLLMSAF